MTVEVVVGGGMALIAAIVVLSVVLVFLGRARSEKARADWRQAEQRGVLPASLHPRIDLDLCIGSGTCVEACPEVDVLAVIDGKARLANPSSCIGHGECLRACPVDAIQLIIGHERRGVDLPLVDSTFQTDVPGLYIVGELGGMGLIYNAMTQAMQCMEAVVRQRLPVVQGVHQVVIVGAGPAGIAASLSAMKAGLDFVTIDQESIGGTVLHYPRHKVVMTRPVTLPIYGTIRATEVKKEALLELWQDIVAKTGLTVRTGTKVEGVARAEDGVFEVQTSAGPLRTQRIVLAMGRRGTPRKLGIPGEEQGKVVYRLADPEAYRGARCLVVGGGDAAVEAAVTLAAEGAQVHLAHRGGVFDRIQAKNQGKLDEAVASGRVSLLLEAQPREIGADRVHLEVAGEAVHLDNDYVLVFVGGVLPTPFLEAAGVTVKTFKGEAFAPAN